MSAHVYPRARPMPLKRRCALAAVTIADAIRFLSSLSPGAVVPTFFLSYGCCCQCLLDGGEQRDRRCLTAGQEGLQKGSGGRGRAHASRADPHAEEKGRNYG